MAVRFHALSCTGTRFLSEPRPLGSGPRPVTNKSNLFEITKAFDSNTCGSPGALPVLDSLRPSGIITAEG
jgi:hypothetical protein